MDIQKIFVHFSISIMLFLVVNWIGRKSYSVGYIKFSFLDEKDEANSLNIFLKVFAPIVFLVIISAVFKEYGLGYYIENIINVIYFYISLRILFIVAFERVRIVNWLRIISYYSLIFFISFFFYDKLILDAKSLLPDFEGLKNQVWILILIFLYQIFNNSPKIQEGSSKMEFDYSKYKMEAIGRKKRYVLRKFKYFSNEYEKYLERAEILDLGLKYVVLGIMIYENFNRPRLIRKIERLKHYLTGKEMTLGLMQIKTDVNITDRESVDLGLDKILSSFYEFKEKDSARFKDYESSSIYDFRYVYRATIKEYCPDKVYVAQVLFIIKIIIEQEHSKEERNRILKGLSSEIRNEFSLYSI